MIKALRFCLVLVYIVTMVQIWGIEDKRLRTTLFSMVTLTCLVPFSVVED